MITYLDITNYPRFLIIRLLVCVEGSPASYCTATRGLTEHDRLATGALIPCPNELQFVRLLSGIYCLLFLIFMVSTE